jgi:Copper binding proteins, plastocyanin/azurin family
VSARAWRRGLVALCALCLAGAMAAAVTAALGTPKHRQLARRACQRHHRSKHKRCPAAPRRKPLRAPANPGPRASTSPGAGAISGALNTSGGAGGNVGGAENPPREVPPVQEPGSGGGGGGGGGGAPAGPAHLQISAKEFSLTLSHPSTAAGRLELELVNAGQDEHNLHIRPAAGGPDVGAVGIVLPGRHADVEFNLKPGTYTLYCAIPAHEELGMKATLTVQ